MRDHVPMPVGSQESGYDLVGIAVVPFLVPKAIDLFYGSDHFFHRLIVIDDVIL